MEALLEHLIKLMAQHIGGYDRLAQLLLQEQSALIEHDIERIQKISKAKETLALKIKLLLPAVSQAIQDVARALQLPVDPLPTMAELAAAAPEPWAGKLSLAGLKLARLQQSVTMQNQANHAYVQEALDMISGSIAILTGAALAPKSGYLRNGQTAEASGHRPVRLSREV